jgi:O-antigen/teichoic acid export membrane protein
VLLTPLFNTIYPQFTKLIFKGQVDELLYFYRNSTRVFLALLFPITATVSLFSRELVHVWTGNDELSFQTASLVSVLISGTALNGVMHFPYALQLSHGKYQIALKICLLLILIAIPTLFYLTSLYGAIGGASSWFITNLCYLFVGTYLTHRHLLQGNGMQWFFRDVVVPLVIAYTIVFSCGAIIKTIGASPILQLAMALPVMLLGTLAVVLYAPMARGFLKDSFQSSRLKIST